MTRHPQVLLESYADGHDSASWLFSELKEVIAATAPAEVIPALRRVEAVVAGGYHAAGFVSYDAANGIEPGHTVRATEDFPLLWFGVFRHRLPVKSGTISLDGDREGFVITDWQSSLDRRSYTDAVATIRELIGAGHTYQVNFSLRQRFRFAGSPFDWYRELCRSQRAPFCAFLDTGRQQILSASPELFFKLVGNRLTVRPMKGTAGRGRWCEEDRAARQNLRESPKERAENLMIVDLLRSDLGMIAETGTVDVSSLFEVETFPTLHQMTSTITARVKEGADMIDLFRALFPCGSVTGAPKRRTMEIIAALEDSPRGLFTGCVGYLSPGPEAVFSVAIRTAVINSETGMGEMGVGSGITWDSSANAEFDECLVKGRFAMEPVPEFSLIETLLCDEQTGYILLERHLARLIASAAYFNFPLDPLAAREQLAKLAVGLSGSHKVRLLLARDGSLSLESSPVAGDSPGEPLVVTLTDKPVDSSDPFLYHKSTRRALYKAERSRHPRCADVLFSNEREEVTEGSSNNIVVQLDGKLITPPLFSGLLPGVFRQELLERRVVMERIVTRSELKEAAEIYLINSVRGWRRAILV